MNNIKPETRAGLKKIAASFGLLQTSGRHRGEGSIRLLLEAIATGELQAIPASARAEENEVDRVLPAPPVI